MTVWGRFAAHVILWRWVLAIAMLAMLMLSLMPASVPAPSTGWDKSNHALGFAALAFLAHWARPARIPMALLGLLGYGALIEVLQSLTPDRFAEWSDLSADGVGLLIGAALAAMVQRLVAVRST
ncbi:VanZ family protein [Variovorax boronicumulans]|uniref:VanZ family protein n=1 Tax=Variovorax boronicumulans TaxID=436515 RepID=A0AAW8E476_9BURK|nr:VanZ family protein [Variovorax boronicumulans]MDP9881368.1 VanZ family protein [Variovorax boronicumulans]MDP9926655.1 VanZ family protein [Variovorax boronicumulans]